jgi:SET domain-containing protein
MILSCLYTKYTEQRGWGVYTHAEIEDGEVIEISPVVVMSAEDRVLLDQTELYNYIFEWDENKCCLGMGYISVYNHSYQSNCEYFQDYDDNTILIRTTRHIKADEELFINYNGDWDNDKPVWFNAI